MNEKWSLQEKVLAFKKRYFQLRLIAGTLLFLGFFGMLFLLAALLENLLWLDVTSRTWVFYLLVISLVSLLAYYIVVPLFYWFYPNKGLSNEEASVQIGEKISDVSDKLINALQLYGADNDLSAASYKQQEQQLKRIDFRKALDYKYLRFGLICVSLPLLVMLMLIAFNQSSDLTSAYARVVNYDTSFEKPAPFSFNLINEKLRFSNKEEVVVEVLVKGEVIPESLTLVNGKNTYSMNKENSAFTYNFGFLNEDTSFHLQANGFSSKEYDIRVYKVPSIEQIRLQLNYPPYTGKSNEVIEGTGNHTVPQGTTAKWELRAENSSVVSFIMDGSRIIAEEENGIFRLTKSNIKNDLAYRIGTSNENVVDFELLDYNLKMIEDEHPKIRVEKTAQNQLQELADYSIEFSDDYLVNSLKVVVLKEGDSLEKSVELLTVPTEKGALRYTFPQGVQLDSVGNYSYYFVAKDNDAVNGSKTARSQVFSHRKSTVSEQMEKEEEVLKESINALTKQAIDKKGDRRTNQGIVKGFKVF